MLAAVKVVQAMDGHCASSLFKVSQVREVQAPIEPLDLLHDLQKKVIREKLGTGIKF